MHPGAWLVWAVCGGLIAMLTTNPFYLLPLFAVAWLVHAARGQGGERGRSFRLFVGFGIVALFLRTALVALGPVTSGSIAGAALEGLRLAVMLAVFGTFNSVADPFRILRLAPRRWYEPALAAALALSLAPRMVESVGRVREAQRLRGIAITRLRSLPSLAVPVLATGMEQALTLAESMDARGHGRGPRSRYRKETFARASAATTASAALAAGAFLAATFAGFGNTIVATFPLRWPESSPLLLGAVVVLALPALWAEEAAR